MTAMEECSETNQNRCIWTYLIWKTAMGIRLSSAEADNGYIDWQHIHWGMYYKPKQ